MITHQLQKFTPTWARISSDHNVFCTLGEGGQRRGPMPLGFSCVFLGGHLPQTSSVCSAKQILVASFATQGRAHILNSRGGTTTAGSNAPGAFLAFC